MLDAQIRKASGADKHILAELNKDVQKVHADAYPELFKQPDNTSEVVADFESRILPDQDAVVLILEAGGQAVGYIYARVVARPETPYTHAQRYLLIDQISVKPDYQRYGFGKRLMEAICDEASKRGVSRLMLGMYTFNTKAANFYARMGFSHVYVQMALDL